MQAPLHKFNAKANNKYAEQNLKKDMYSYHIHKSLHEVM